MTPADRLAEAARYWQHMGPRIFHALAAYDADAERRAAERAVIDRLVEYQEEQDRHEVRPCLLCALGLCGAVRRLREIE